MKRSEARDRHRYGVDGVVTQFVGKRKRRPKRNWVGGPGNCSGGLEKGTLNRSVRDGKGAGTVNV